MNTALFLTSAVLAAILTYISLFEKVRQGVEDRKPGARTVYGWIAVAAILLLGVFGVIKDYQQSIKEAQAVELQKKSEEQAVAARAESERQAKLAEDQEYATARKNIHWVIIDDGGARGRYNDEIRKGRSPWEAARIAQNHNESAKKTIEDYGSVRTNRYIRELVGNG